ncbi:MAG TPA: hypothetical protein VH815_10795 [Acidobacteriota bacterium]|jgi:hypothetical protein
MQIEVHGSDSFLEEFRLNFHDQLQKNGYLKGPKVGNHETYMKGDVILSIEISEESEGRECCFHVESEQDISELPQMWDNALVEYAKQMIDRVEKNAQDPSSVKKTLKSLL